MSDHQQQIEQAVRRSHCAHEHAGSPQHQCAGTCKITPTGIELECALCGSDSPSLEPDAETAEHARQVLRAAGLDYDALTLDRQCEVVRALTRLRCRGCGRVADSTRGWSSLSYVRGRCLCGWRWDHRLGWLSPQGEEVDRGE